MVRKLAWVALAACCLAGCGQSRVAGILPANRGRDALGTTDVCVVTMERLRSERLPTRRAVERWRNEYGPGLTLTTDHYEVFTTVLEPLMLRTIPGFLESAYWGYNDQLIRPIETVTRFSVYLFAARSQWEDFTRGFAGDQAAIFCRIKTGAYCLNGSCVAYDLGGSRTLAALGHEGWHQFNSRHFK